MTGLRVVLIVEAVAIFVYISKYEYNKMPGRRMFRTWSFARYDIGFKSRI